jgi:hypothetical protein
MNNVWMGVVSMQQIVTRAFVCERLHLIRSMMLEERVMYIEVLKEYLFGSDNAINNENVELFSFTLKSP